MRYRRFGRLGWQVSEIGYGMWGIAGGEGGWTGADDERADTCLREAVRLGCNFFDTAWIYGRGHSEKLLAGVLADVAEPRLYVATKVPPKNRQWPSKRGDRLQDIFPREHVREFAYRSLENLGIPRIDLMQFHVWEDAWSDDESWRRIVDDLKAEGVVAAWGVSVNRWEPWNCVRTLQTGAIDTVQVIYNIFDQAPEDELFEVCQSLDIAIIARVPFDEGTLTGTLTMTPSWPETDWRHSYFVPENLRASVERAERLLPIIPKTMTMPELALRFILENPVVHTVIPGMRRLEHVRTNTGVSDGRRLDGALLSELRRHRWDRVPTAWSQ